MPIIFNGQDMVAHHHPGGSAYLLVTFLGAFHEEEADATYLMKDHAERDGIHVVGVTSRVRNLYLSPEIDEVAARVHELRRPGQKVILLGQSIGGFAAIKFADLFGADQVVAFSPIFSVDETDLCLTPAMEGERQILRSAIRFHRVPLDIIRPGMRPGPETCSAPVLIAYDVGNSNDAFAANRFGELFPAGRIVRAKNLGHAVFDRLHDSNLFATLLGLLAADDMDGAQLLVERTIRNSEAALTELLVKIARWRPAMVPVALRTARMRDNLKPDLRRSATFNTVLAYELTARGDMAGACDHLREIYPELFPREVRDTGLFLVVSHHGDVLRYEHGEVRLVPGMLNKAGSAPVLLDVRASGRRFIIQLRTGDTTVIADRRGAERDGVADDAFNVVPVPGRSLVAFRRGGAFMRGDFNSLPVFTAAEALAWEQFALIPVSNLDVFRESASLNWLDQAAVAVREGSGPAPAAGPATRKTAFRSAMQRFFAG